MVERIYVASRASIQARSLMWRNYRAEGAKIISTWIDEAGEGETNDFADLWTRIKFEVTTATRLVMYAEPEDFPVRGVLVEVGLALAANVPVFLTLPGVELKGPTLRPLGSWAKHPLCVFEPNLRKALLL